MTYFELTTVALVLIQPLILLILLNISRSLDISYKNHLRAKEAIQKIVKFINYTEKDTNNG